MYKRFLRKEGKLIAVYFFFQMTTRILEAHANVQEMTLLEAKLNYIKAWQALPEYGITYFIIKFKDQKKEVSWHVVICKTFLCITIVSRDCEWVTRNKPYKQTNKKNTVHCRYIVVICSHIFSVYAPYLWGVSSRLRIG